MTVVLPIYTDVYLGYLDVFYDAPNVRLWLHVQEEESPVVSSLQAWMRKENMDCFIVPSDDPHLRYDARHFTQAQSVELLNKV